MLGLFGMQDDGPDLVAVDHLPGVHVADRRLAGPAALLGLLVHALGDLGGEVLAVELRDRGHDPVQQGAGGCFVDVLGHRHQRRAGFSDRQVDRDIIRAVTGQSVDLVDDDVIDIALLG
ncbi:MAG: hypothetical protein M0Z42_05880 [Actinomycetota bacterium]|nr:hypothetical protein [Actinomycetota bacterium]